MPAASEAVEWPASSARRTQRVRRAEAERRVLDATARLVASGGSASATLAEVGSVAGYSRGIVTHHFGTRQALLAALAREAQARVKPYQDQPPGLDRLVAAVRSYIELVESGDLYARALLVLWAESVNASAELRAIFAARDRSFMAAIVEDLDAGQAHGTIRDLDSTAVALAVIGQLRGAALQLVVGDSPVRPNAVAEVIVTGLQRSLGLDPWT